MTEVLETKLKLTKAPDAITGAQVFRNVMGGFKYSSTFQFAKRQKQNFGRILEQLKALEEGGVAILPAPKEPEIRRSDRQTRRPKELQKDVQDPPHNTTDRRTKGKRGKGGTGHRKDYGKPKPSDDGKGAGKPKSGGMKKAREEELPRSPDMGAEEENIHPPFDDRNVMFYLETPRCPKP